MKLSLVLQSIALCLVSLVQAAQLTISIPSSQILDNPSALPPSTHATLLGPDGHLRRALLTRSNTLSFPSLPIGAHLLNIHSRDYTFAPLRVDVSPSTTAEGTAEIIEVHQTFRGNEWSNKGQKYGSAKSQLVIAIPPIGKRDFYQARGGFDIASLFKNPMILIGLASMGLVFGMPYLMDNSKRRSRSSRTAVRALIDHSGRGYQGRVRRNVKEDTYGFAGSRQCYAEFRSCWVLGWK